MIIITIHYPHLDTGSGRPLEALDFPSCAGPVGFDEPKLNIESMFSLSEWTLVKWAMPDRLLGLT
jgi:hypothetical protein